MWNAILEIIFHLLQEMVTLFIMAQKLWDMLPENIKDSENNNISNQMLSFWSLRTDHAVCAKSIWQI